MPPLAILVALADPTRCRIIEILHGGAQPVHMLAGHFDISRPAISRHLRVLRQARLISEKKVGRENRYALHANRLQTVQDWLAGLAPASKPAPEPKVVARPKPARKAKPAVAVASAPIPPQPPARTAPKPAPVSAVSQMGFDF
ncbi:metalloregulator ArsR/SmtB family transcription factor [Devosia ginsengisoli]|uniref:metalloregulator ArsR/SmtB family transcription factor n=1 Tax=Devosia ginsengisoli TaxID=400770 RepID=UPI0026F1B2F7|nr:metalloregulator ArsR/SmtB family transcription factor [Devosia ginsengisoli]MCR6672882.1 metalloregulator ArsR/SmtB family transcription factor [Devosia ginsengisoli]